MNIESFISFLSHSNWIFLAALILALGAAFAVSFRNKPSPGPNPPSKADPKR
jgi:uncharacterized protein involved in exopolysaccharide biosynthesis